MKAADGAVAPSAAFLILLQDWYGLCVRWKSQPFRSQVVGGRRIYGEISHIRASYEIFVQLYQRVSLVFVAFVELHRPVLQFENRYVMLMVVNSPYRGDYTHF